jgi:endoglucanase
MDSLITVGCLSPHGVAVRMRELRAAIDVLSTVPHLVVYLDAGAADALTARREASLLRRAGVSKIEGFFLNSTHFDWTSKEIQFGEAVSRLTGGKHFVVNTGESGRGPLTPPHPVKQGNEVLCNPAGRGLGPVPTANTGYPNVDAFAWTSNPGESGGPCVPGAPKTGVYWPAYGLALIRNANFNVDSTVNPLGPLGSVARKGGKAAAKAAKASAKKLTKASPKPKRHQPAKKKKKKKKKAHRK